MLGGKRRSTTAAVLAFAVAALGSVAVGPAAVAGGSGSQRTLRGTLERVISDDHFGRPSEPGAEHLRKIGRDQHGDAAERASVVVDGRRIPVSLEQAGRAASGSTVLLKVQARSADQTTADLVRDAAAGTAPVAELSVEQAAATTAAVGTHHVSVVPLFWKTASLPAGEPTTTDLAAAFAGVDSYWDQASEGQVRVTVDSVRAWPSQPETLTYDNTIADACDRESNAVANRAIQLAGSVAADAFHHVVAYYPKSDTCAFEGRATVGASNLGFGFIWLNGPTWLDGVASHEIGHNFTLRHSGMLDCFNGTVQVTLSDDCDHATYWDSWDVMGAMPFGQMGMTSAEHLRQLGAMSAGGAATITASGPVTLGPLTGTSGLRGASFTVGSRTFLLEYRTPVGLDAWIDDLTFQAADGSPYTAPLGGIVVRVVDSAAPAPFNTEEDSLDFHPDSDFSRPPVPGLQLGESWSGPSGLSLHVTSMSDSSAVVDVTLPDNSVTRLAGADRYATSAAISAASFGPGAPVAYVASGAAFPDALSGAPAAGTARGPVLLTAPTSLPSSIRAELDRLQPQRIVALGGSGAVSSTVFEALKGYTAGTVTRLAGVDRYATSAKISAASFAPDPQVAFVAGGSNFPDALSGAPWAGANQGPVLLTSATSLPSSITTELTRLKPREIYVLGGTSMVSDAVLSQLAKYATQGVVKRYAGANRYETSAKISNEGYVAPRDVVYVASGEAFPDALSGAAVAAMGGAPLLLTKPTSLPTPIQSALTRLSPTKIVILGGAGAVSGSVAAALQAYTP
ncbi:MAG TPA: cell wall-binding repeat-containing protein [Dermatophilaceae bacterium]|nr:cell wall-binding repeat-containing protein [Dermatophilaceae bacterium]